MSHKHCHTNFESSSDDHCKDKCKIKCKRGKRGHDGLRGPTGPTGLSGAATNTGATGPTGASLGALIPFASGLIVNPTVIAALNTNLVMGFGVSTTPANVSNIQLLSGYAVPIPQSASITQMEISGDILTALVLTPQTVTYTFTVYRSTSTNSGSSAVANAFVATSLSGAITFTLSANATSYTASNLITGPLAVSAGDRLALVVTASTGAIPSTVFAALALNASLTYA